ncbi:MAG: M24 family metallopeptidase [Candidatus Kapaibacteriales bacterium]
MKLSRIQEELQKSGFDGWLFCDFHGRDMIGNRILGIGGKHLASRRWFYYVPAKGEPRKLVHKIEPRQLDALPGNEKNVYLHWKELREGVGKLLRDGGKVAMQYSPMNNIPYVSVVDKGTTDLVESFGVEIVSSDDLVSIFESYITPAEKETHAEASRRMHSVLDKTYEMIKSAIEKGEPVNELEAQKFMHEGFDRLGLFYDHGPIVAVNENAADPHYEPGNGTPKLIKKGDLLLIDMFARLQGEGNIWYDVTWMAYLGNEVPERIQQVWEICRDARNAGYGLVKERFEANEPIEGWEVDEATRKVIVDAELGEFFTHRTGHNIATELHGNGTHMDNLETKDTRKVIKGSCFSIEPGIYIPEEKIGFRTEIDVFVDDDGSVGLCGPIQEDLILIDV